MSVVALVNQKGGVGKSTLTMNLAAVKAAALTDGMDGDVDSPVAAISVDPQGSALWWADRVDELPFMVDQILDNVEVLRNLDKLPGIKHVYVDTPGWFDLRDKDNDDAGGDLLGTGTSADALRAVLDVSDFVIVPITTEPLSFDPTARTIKKLLEPLGKKYIVVINNWDPRDGKIDLDQTREFIAANGWPVAKTVVRRYKVHARAAADGRVVTEYEPNRTALQAREDFWKLSVELSDGVN